MKASAHPPVESAELTKTGSVDEKLKELNVNQPKPIKKINIFINDDKYVAPKPDMTGAELKVLANIAAQNQLFQDAPGHHDDPQVFDDIPFHLKSGMKFYDVPVGNLGGR